MESITIHVNPDWNIVESKTSTGATGYRFYPDRLRGEGFFSCLRKRQLRSQQSRERKQLKKFQKEGSKGFANG